MTLNNVNGKDIIHNVNTELSDLLWKFSHEYVEQYKQKHGHLPLVDYDPLWESKCQQGFFDDNTIHWLPADAENNLLFDNVENALNIHFHPDFKTYFTRFYSESLNAQCEEGQLSLLFAWNVDDFERLQENIIGHVLMKQKLKQAITLFFAVTDEEDTILSIVNDTGEIWVERVGCEPHKKVADSFASFIQQLSPSTEV